MYRASTADRLEGRSGLIRPRRRASPGQPPEPPEGFLRGLIHAQEQGARAEEKAGAARKSLTASSTCKDEDCLKKKKNHDNSSNTRPRLDRAFFNSLASVFLPLQLLLHFMSADAASLSDNLPDAQAEESGNDSTVGLSWTWAMCQTAWSWLRGSRTASHSDHATVLVLITLLCALAIGVKLLHSYLIPKQPLSSSTPVSVSRHSSQHRSMRRLRRPTFDPHETDPGLLKKHSTFQSYQTSYATYPSLRTFYRVHPQADKLPSTPTPLPLIVFVHGLGGSLAQFKPILTSLVDVGPCFGIDLPGCGRSTFAPRTWSAYTPQALAELLKTAIEQHLAPSQEYVLIGHSLGSTLCALVAQAAHPSGTLSPVLGIISICPAAEMPSGRKATIGRIVLALPSCFFDIFRMIDRIGGPESKSVKRFVGEGATLELRKLQERFNAQSRTPVYRRMALALLDEETRATLGLKLWASLTIPIFLIGGDGDVVTPVDQVTRIATALGRRSKPTNHLKAGHQNSDGMTDHGEKGRAARPASETETTLMGHPKALPKEPNGVLNHFTLRRKVVKTTIFPCPAAHGLLYDPATSRTLSGLIQTFLYEHIDTRLSLGWQLQHLSTEGKWDVKNLVKWQAVPAVSEPIANIFRAMKTLREVDEEHCPAKFAAAWRGKIKAVIDISHESPVYDPKGLEDRGIEYHKFPTVSKLPPSPDEVLEFIKLVDHINATKLDQRDEVVGVHYHYGFNRTGFFICAYLIETQGFSVAQAIEEFAKARPPGIRHAHFLDELSVRYYEGLRRGDTM